VLRKVNYDNKPTLGFMY